MQESKLRQLAQIEHVRSSRSLQQLQKLQAEESELRRQIETLSAHRRHSHHADPGLIPMRAIGADVIWQRWIDSTQRDLTMELARLKARKVPVLERARKDVGRRDVVQELSRQEEQTVRSERRAAHLETVLALATLQAATRL